MTKMHTFEARLDHATATQRERYTERLYPGTRQLAGRELTEKEQCFLLWLAGWEEETIENYMELLGAIFATCLETGVQSEDREPGRVAVVNNTDRPIQIHAASTPLEGETTIPRGGGVAFGVAPGHEPIVKIHEIKPYGLTVYVGGAIAFETGN